LTGQALNKKNKNCARIGQYMPDIRFETCPVTKEKCECEAACRILALDNYLGALVGSFGPELYTVTIPGMLEGLSGEQVAAFYRLRNLPQPPKCEKPLEVYDDLFARLGVVLG
jgi:hypothetical protein